MTFNPTTDYISQSGKIVNVYDIEAPSIEEALSQIPGDFKIYSRVSNGNDHRIEVIRTF